jgi:hypothetical protein
MFKCLFLNSDITIIDDEALKNFHSILFSSSRSGLKKSKTGVFLRIGAVDVINMQLMGCVVYLIKK